MIVNKQGFTLVELLATIVVLGLIAGIATVAYTGIVNDSATRVFESYEDTMHAEAVYRLTNFYSDVNFVNNNQ
jgi:prepilin-type N-terminal cleavage/methylation domain-containing protein